MTEEQAREYSESLGKIVEGAWRQIKWAHQMGIPKKLGLALDEWVNEYSGGYSKLSVSDRSQAVIEMSQEGMSQREIAGVLGVSHQTVKRDQAPVTNVTKNNHPTREPVTNVTETPREYCEVGWLLLTSERDMAVLALTPANENWEKSALEYYGSLRKRGIVTVS